MFDVATSMRDFRLPELSYGFERGESAGVVAYPGACIPHAPCSYRARRSRTDSPTSSFATSDWV